MNEASYIEIIKDQTKRALWSLSNVIECVPIEYWNENYCEMPLWKHIYHTLHSLDMWYINPRKYSHPLFHIENLNNLDIKTDKILSKEELKHYYLIIEEKINKYNNSLTNDILLAKPENSEWTRFTLILAQHRHLHSHMGMIMGFIIAETGLWPKVVGLEDDIPTGDYSLYFNNNGRR
ncbi:hypothetical protein [Clostridium estertheticum]|uniref:hypothetical protein n=1 Tax=Clostridium estertheticum TaxID=238834 RepID=UPI001C0B85A6|nr:hypothetical protein [Clostridium estertheticum]MBU3073131.1 hypothetical protein [Clostridium estertheticum]MBU3162832.1 hypothetical protein [Clostridium estertheticum]